MKALILDAENKTAQVKIIPSPTPSPTDLLISVQTVALNPIDPLYVSHPLGTTGRTIGSDFAGSIVSLGSSVPASSNLQPGDHVAGFLQGACSVNPRPGAFAEKLVCPWDLVWKVPNHVSLQEAATVNLCGLTAAQAVYYRLGIDAPFSWSSDEPSTVQQGRREDNMYFFIYGASTSVGLYAAQLVHQSAKASGKNIKLLGAASPKRFQMLRSEPYCYNFLADYRDQSWSDQIKEIAGGEGVHYAYDCISEGDTVQRTSSTLREGGQLAIVRSREGGAWAASDLSVEPIYGAVWEGLGVEVQYQNMVLQASKEAREFATEFYKWLSKGGKLRPNPVRLMPGGLESVVKDGFALLGPGLMDDRGHGRTEEWVKPVSAEKLVYKISA